MPKLKPKPSASDPFIFDPSNRRLVKDVSGLKGKLDSGPPDSGSGFKLPPSIETKPPQYSAYPIESSSSQTGPGQYEAFPGGSSAQTPPAANMPGPGSGQGAQTSPGGPGAQAPAEPPAESLPGPGGYHAEPGATGPQTSPQPSEPPAPGAGLEAGGLDERAPPRAEPSSDGTALIVIGSLAALVLGTIALTWKGDPT